jgi:PelA/Pel-15E family pectate lyase
VRGDNPFQGVEMNLFGRAVQLSLLFALTCQVQARIGDIHTDAEATSAGPVRLIFDTDMDTDVDDAGALAMLHALADNGEVEILATMVSSLYPWSVPATDAINHHYGRPHLPIGSPKGEGATLDRTFRYAKEIAEEFPHRLRSNDEAPDASKLYREILAAQPDRSVVIVTVGYVTNLWDLLRTEPDEFSPLSGRDLAARTVKLWVCMGGRYPVHLDPRPFGNFKPHPEAAVGAVRHWPTPITFTGIGDEIPTGSLLPETPTDNPVRRAYELFLRATPTRPSWDQVAVLYAVRGLGPYFELQTEGFNHIFEDGTNVWRLSSDEAEGRHCLLHLKMDGEKLAAVIDRLMIQPPKRTAKPAVDAGADDPPSREEVERALRKAVEFYRKGASIEGGYHFSYTDDLSYGRSEHSEGWTQAEVQRGGTLVVATAYLTAYEATGDPYYLEAARETALALTRGQLCSGGWDYSIEFDPDRRVEYPYRADGNCDGWEPRADDEFAEARRRRFTNLDDNVTPGALRILMRVDRELGFKDEAIHEAARYGLEGLMRAQYPSGGWPQRYNRLPDPEEFPVLPAGYPESWPRQWPGPASAYFSHYTFNDNSIQDAIDALLEAARIYNEPRYRKAAEKGGDFIILAQMPEPQPGWAQQYDRNMHPAWARRFEPPAVTGGESQSVMEILLVLYRETGEPKYLEPLSRALDYFERSVLPEVEHPSETRRRDCPPGSLCLARFYELESNRPLYITKGSRVRVPGQPTNFLDGYEVSYSDESVITHYSFAVPGDRLPRIRRELERLRSEDPSNLRRPDRLRGLSPWAGGLPPVGAGPMRPLADAESLEAEELAMRVRAALDQMDDRGAWVQEGTIGRAERIVLVFAAEDMVATLGDRVFSMRENDTLEIFPGKDVPGGRIISSRTFARKVELLSLYLQQFQQGSVSDQWLYGDEIQ